MSSASSIPSDDDASIVAFPAVARAGGSGEKRKRVAATSAAHVFEFRSTNAAGHSLHPYQIDGVRFMWRLWCANIPAADTAAAAAAAVPAQAAAAGAALYIGAPGAELPCVPGGCLADDMGLGKVSAGKFSSFVVVVAVYG